MKKITKRRVEDDVEENPRRTVKKALRRADDEDSRPRVSRPEGILLIKQSDKYQLRAEISDFTGEEQFVIQRWVKTQKAGWVRTKARLGLDFEHARELAAVVGAAVEELLPAEKRKKRRD